MRLRRSAAVDFNISLVRLAQTTSTFLELHQVKTSLPANLIGDNTSN